MYAKGKPGYAECGSAASKRTTGNKFLYTHNYIITYKHSTYKAIGTLDL